MRGHDLHPLFLFLSEHSPFNKYFNTVGTDPAVRDALAAIPSGVATIVVFGLARLLLEYAGVGSLRLQAQDLFGAPFLGAESNLGTGVGFVALSQFLWFFGVHGPNILFGVEKNILVVASQINIDVAALGLKPVLIITKPFLDAFVHIGGSGSTLALILAIFLRSKEKNIRKLALVALIPALFNVNEVILFGLPLVINPIYAVPFLLAPVLQTVLAYAATALDLVPHTISNIHWTSPPILGGYAAVGSPAGAVLQVACLALGTLVYLPFVSLANSVYSRRYQRAMETLVLAAESTATGPTGKKCIDLPGQPGQVAEILAADLALALDRGEQLFLVYQPQVDVSRGGITVGAEALLRWRHPIHGLVPPQVTVALAEDKHLISRLGLAVLREGCRQHAQLHSQGLCEKVLSVNMSAPQLDDEDLVEKVMALLEETGVDPGLLKIEITESVALTPEARPVAVLRRLRENGIRVAIDDFGMGHTSLRYLKEFQVDTLKIDRSLTLESADGVNDYIIASIVSLCDSLGIQIIIEGVETEEQVERFLAHGCSIYQGYYFSKPLPFEEYENYCRACELRE